MPTWMRNGDGKIKVIYQTIMTTMAVGSVIGTVVLWTLKVYLDIQQTPMIQNQIQALRSQDSSNVIWHQSVDQFISRQTEVSVEMKKFNANQILVNAKMESLLAVAEARIRLLENRTLKNEARR